MLYNYTGKLVNDIVTSMKKSDIDFYATNSDDVTYVNFYVQNSVVNVLLLKQLGFDKFTPSFPLHKGQVQWLRKDIFYVILLHNLSAHMEIKKILKKHLHPFLTTKFNNNERTKTWDACYNLVEVCGGLINGIPLGEI